MVIRDPYWREGTSVREIDKMTGRGTGVGIGCTYIHFTWYTTEPG